MKRGERPATGGTQFWTHDGLVLRSAVISRPLTDYRYQLARRWAKQEDDDTVCWVMLNPSTADGTVDDPTVRRCVGFSTLWGFNAIIVVNLFAYRASTPAMLNMADDPLGPYNVEWVKHSIARSALVVVGWGASKRKDSPIDLRADEYRQGREVVCLGRTKDGSPRHPGPLGMLPMNTEREEWR